MHAEFSFRRTAILVTAMFVTLNGCNALQHHSKRKDVPKTVGMVIVGGEVRHPRQLQIPKRGLTLQDAVALSGGIQTQAFSQSYVTDSRSRAPSKDPFNDAESALKNLRFSVVEFRAMQTIEKRNAVREMQGKVGSLIGKIVIQFKTDQDAQRLKSETAELVRALIVFRNQPNATTFQNFNQRASSVEKLVAGLKTRHQSSISVGNSPQPPNNSRPVTLVSLQRGQGFASATYYFPAEFANTGIGGAVQLQDGDRVFAVNMNDTSLANRPQIRQSVTVTGLVRKVGRTQVSYLKTLFSGENAPLAGIKDLNTNRTVVALTRMSQSGFGKEVFVIPYGDERFYFAPAYARDNYHLTPPALIPIIRKSLTQSRLADAVASVNYKPRPKSGTLERHFYDMHKQKERLMKPITESTLKAIPQSGPK